MKRVLGVGAASIFLLFAESVAVWARTWTDNDGNRTSATFLRMENGNVVLQRTGTKQTIPVGFYQLSAADREFVRNVLKSKGQEGLIPTAGETRIWTDRRGQTIEAQFLSLANQNVVLLANDKPTSFPFGQFSTADQDYVREQLEARGQGHLVPRTSNPGQQSPNDDPLTGRQPRQNQSIATSNAPPASAQTPAPANSPATNFDSLTGSRFRTSVAPSRSAPPPSIGEDSNGGLRSPGYRPARQMNDDVLDRPPAPGRRLRHHDLRPPEPQMDSGLYCPVCQATFAEGTVREGSDCPNCLRNARYRVRRWSGLGLLLTLLACGLRRLLRS